MKSAIKKIIGIILLVISLMILLFCYLFYQMIRKYKYLLNYGTNKLTFSGLLILGLFLFFYRCI